MTGFVGFLQTYQLDLMLVLGGVCGTVSFFGLGTPHISRIKKYALFLMSISATILLFADRLAYLYRGDASTTGWWMVRVCNFLVFFLTLVGIHAFNIYLSEMLKTDAKLGHVPRPLKLVEILAALGEMLIIISQFTGLYYTFDAQNTYHRADGFIICYILPLLSLLIQSGVILFYRKALDPHLWWGLLLFTLLPVAASVTQIFYYGVSLSNLTFVGLVVLLRVNEVHNTNRRVLAAKEKEREFLRQDRENMRTMIGETAYALAEAVEAKDEYTHGHSSRVANYSEMIAQRAGMSERDCENIYLVALLHDVGKIGIPGSIINKDTRLSDEEYAIIKTHPVIGNQILQKIRKNPTLSIGAHYHHERYDGKGYPDGLKGEEIPEIARIIAVADAYDAMTSKRSYRDPLPQQVVRGEIAKGIGTQFDPHYARIMLDLIDEDADYQMCET